jgi:hypothetical protein
LTVIAAQSSANIGDRELKAPAPSRGEAMCVKCAQLDNKIDHYNWLSKQMTDRRTLDGIASLIKEMADEKTALHPRQQEIHIKPSVH